MADEQTQPNNEGAAKAPSPPPATETPKDPLEECRSQAQEYLNGWKRAKADLINYKKEEGARFEEFAKFAAEGLTHELLVVLDSFELALASLDEKNPAQKGVYIIKSQLEHILKGRGLAPIAVRAGEEKFDPRLHEAVAEISAEKPPGTVVEVVEAGYLLHGKILRPVKVKIAK